MNEEISYIELAVIALVIIMALAITGFISGMLWILHKIEDKFGKIESVD